MTVDGQKGDQRQDLRRLCSEVLDGSPLIVASNRGPIEYGLRRDGSLQIQRGQGGVVTALSSIGHYAKTVWVASAMGDGDRVASQFCGAAHIHPHLPGQDLRIRFVTSPKAVYERFYNEFSNPLLWFLQHRMSDRVRAQSDPKALLTSWQKGYVPVNRAFAEAAVLEARQAGPMPVIMLHDYHLYLVGQGIRSMLPDSVIQHFIHIPWPSPLYWQVLPAWMVRAICRSLCACDIVGFQTERDVRHFLVTVEKYVPDSKVNYALRSVVTGGQTTLVRHYPISVDVAAIQETVNSAAVRTYVRKLQRRCGDRTILRVDRLEPTKNIINGFRAFELFLRLHPEFVRRVKFLAFLVPSRESIAEYQRYASEVWRLVGRINATYGGPDWEPIDVYYENNYEQALAAMQLYDVLLVNPATDGMNLVAKEGPVVNQRNGVLVLSEGAGAYEQLYLGAIGVSPEDIEGTAQALYDGLVMPNWEKREKAEYLRRIITREDVGEWFRRQFEDLSLIIPSKTAAFGLPPESARKAFGGVPYFPDDSYGSPAREIH